MVTQELSVLREKISQLITLKFWVPQKKVWVPQVAQITNVHSLCGILWHPCCTQCGTHKILSINIVLLVLLIFTIQVCIGIEYKNYNI